MEREPVIYREEAMAILGVLADINVNARRIRDLLEEELGGEETLEEDDS
jgi:hypothetical protein